jgi:hypothetical protein
MTEPSNVVPLRRRRVTRHPERRPRNGHHADCPYPTTDVTHCTICQAIRKGQP